MKISILDAQRTLFEGAVSEAVLPACDGEMTLLDHHEPIFVALRKGMIRLKPLGQKVAGRSGKLTRVPIRRGVARMKSNELVILVES